MLKGDEAGAKTQTTKDSSSDDCVVDILFVWDFDWTVINCNSDEYIPAQFMDNETLNDGFRSLYKETNGDWHACVEGMVNRCITRNNIGSNNAAPATEDIMEAARKMPYLIGVRNALDDIHKNEKSCQMILSDGNTLFIRAFLEKQSIQNHFTDIISNLGKWTDDGQLKVSHQSLIYGGHNCNRCSANLCKTQALKQTISSSKDNKSTINRPKRIVYVGDGANDACPVLNVLREGDTLLARVGEKRHCANARNGPETDTEAICGCGSDEEQLTGSSFGILPALQKAPSPPKCQVLHWKTGDELQQLIQKILL